LPPVRILFLLLKGPDTLLLGILVRCVRAGYEEWASGRGLDRIAGVDLQI